MANIEFTLFAGKSFGNKEGEKNLQNTLILIAVAIAFCQTYKNKNLNNKQISADKSED